MDILYVLGGGSKWENNEIKYSLRSIEKHLTGFNRVFIVGRVPDFLKDIIFYPFEDTDICKEVNIYKKIEFACNIEDLSEDFLFFNDDHFLTKDFFAPLFPFFYKGTMEDGLRKASPNNIYSRSVYNTKVALEARGFKTLNFDTHTPIIFNKKNFLKVNSEYDWTNCFGLVIKSLYANTLGIEGIYQSDGKINYKFIAEEFFKVCESRSVISIGDRAITEQLEVVMKMLYPNRSRWEK